MADRLDGLFHDAVIRGDNQDDKIGDLCAASAHARESLVAGRIDEHDAAAILGNDGCSDVLRDATGFAARNVRRADHVEQ